MSITLNPYLNFQGDAREAMEFYQSVFGGELTLSTFGEMKMSESPADAAKIMHGQLEGERGIVLMGADAPSSMQGGAGGGTISLSGDDGEVLQGYWQKLSEGGTVIEPLTMAPWGDSFGMCDDRFGVSWMVNISGPTPE